MRTLNLCSGGLAPSLFVDSSSPVVVGVILVSAVPRFPSLID